jgi:hypothetical protein
MTDVPRKGMGFAGLFCVQAARSHFLRWEEVFFGEHRAVGSPIGTRSDSGDRQPSGIR